MKRFLLFAGYTYYPAGGWNDFRDSFDTFDEGQEHLKKLTEASGYTINWGHIVDTTTTTKTELL